MKIGKKIERTDPKTVIAVSVPIHRALDTFSWLVLRKSAIQYWSGIFKSLMNETLNQNEKMNYARAYSVLVIANKYGASLKRLANCIDKTVNFEFAFKAPDKANAFYEEIKRHEGIETNWVE